MNTNSSQTTAWFSRPPRPALWIAAAALVILSSIGYAISRSSGGGDLVALGPTATVEQGPLTISVAESGTVRPREQVILKNELDAPATIVSVVPEGSIVSKGDLVVELDVTQLENDAVERRIRVQNDESDLIHAQENLKVVQNQAEADIEKAALAYEFAQQDLDKYLQGEYPKLLKEAEAKITLAKEELSRAEEQLKWSRVLFQEKYLAQSELQQDELTAKKAQLNLELAEADLDLLQQYTHHRTLAELKSNLKQSEMALERTKRMAAANTAQAEANLRAREAELEEEKVRLQHVETQIDRAKIYAPIDGMVLYASSVSDDWDDDEDRIDIGATVDERGEIIYLPTAAAFNVDVKVSEVDLNKLRLGLPVRVTIDALPGQVFAGRLSRISQLPDARSRWLNPNLKLYNCEVELEASGANLRNGMSCRAEIMVSRIPDAVYIPIQCVTRLQNEPTVYVVESGVASPRPVVLGLDNNRFIHIVEGLKAGEQVLLAPPVSSSLSITESTEDFDLPPDEPAPEPKPSRSET